MQANDFDGNAAFSGGGFMPSESTQTAPDRFVSSSSKNSDARCLIPLTVKQLKDLSGGGESGVFIDGVDVNNIVLVGIVSKIDNAVSDCTFRVDDGTGWIECTKWIHEHVDSAEADAISVGMYVRVYGQLKSIQNRRTLHTFSIRPLTDFDAIANHFLECIYVHIYNTKLRGSMTNPPQLTNAIGGMTTQSQMTNAYGMTAQPQMTNAYGGMTARPQMTNAYGGMNYQPQLTNSFVSPMKSYQTNHSNQYNTDEEQIAGASSMVLNYLRRPACLASETGVRSDVVARDLNIPLDKIRRILEYLSSEGLVYATKDDHYKFTDA